MLRNTSTSPYIIYNIVVGFATSVTKASKWCPNLPTGSLADKQKMRI